MGFERKKSATAERFVAVKQAGPIKGKLIVDYRLLFNGSQRIPA